MTNVSVELLNDRIRQWQDIRHGQIFMGDGKCSPHDYPVGEATGGYGTTGPWLKVDDGLYDFRSGGYWPNLSSNRVWFEHYHPLNAIRFVECLGVSL